MEKIHQGELKQQFRGLVSCDNVVDNRLKPLRMG